MEEKLKIIVTKENGRYLSNIYSDRLVDKRSDHKGKSVEDVSIIDSTDKIYIFPNCKIKKLPLRKWISHIGAKQVHKPEEATCLVVKRKLTGSKYLSPYDMFEVIERWYVPAGEYEYEKMKGGFRNIISNTWLRKWNMLSFIFDTKIKSYNSNWMWPKLEAEAKAILNELDSTTTVTINNKKINENHLNAVLNRDNKLINELDLQQIVYNWEVDDNIRHDLSENPWESIYAMLCSDNSWKMAIRMIKRGNVESFLSRLVASFYNPKISEAAKEELWDKVFIRMPDLKRSLVRKRMYDTYIYYWNFSNLFNRCYKNNITLDPIVFEEMLGVRIFPSDNSPGRFNAKMLD